MDAFPVGPGLHMPNETIDEMMEREEQEEILEAHRRLRNENSMRSIFRDEAVTLVTLEGQLKVCRCCIVLLVAAAGILASLCAILYNKGNIIQEKYNLLCKSTEQYIQSNFFAS